MTDDVLTLDVPLPGPIFHKQRAVIEAGLSGGKRLKTIACLGGYASGKSYTCAVLTLLLACQNGWTPDYGNSNPRILVVAPTNNILKDTTIPILEQLIPPELILKTKQSPYTITLVNGCKLLCRSAESEIEGQTVAAVWIDEIQHDFLWRDPRRIPNFVGRIRDPNARIKRFVVSGLTAAGMVRERFDRPGVHLTRIRADENPAIGPDSILELKANTDASNVPMLVYGEWGAAPGALFETFDASKHIVDDAPPPRAAIHLAIDVGRNHSHALLFVERTLPLKWIAGDASSKIGILVIDEVSQSGAGLDDLLHKVRISTPHAIGRDSVICIDPTTRYDEVRVIRRHFPNSRIIQRPEVDPYYEREPGLQLMEWGLLDGLGNVRIHFARKLVSSHRGIVYSMENSRRNVRTSREIRDDVVDHSRDCLRYATCYVLGDLQKRGSSSVTVISKR